MLEAFVKRGWRKQRTWTFERLEDRQYFSATPLDFQTVSISNATPEGAYLLALRELQAYAGQLGTGVPMSTMALPSDPLFSSQWHLQNTAQAVGSPDFQPIYGVVGEDINIVGAWEQGYTGEGVIVAVIDSGTQMNHPDLLGNLHPTLRLDAITGDSDPSPRFNDPGTAHGTAVAGLIGAVANNGIGGVGGAPDVQLVPIRLIDVGQSEQAFVDAFRYANDQIDITNNSWGPGLTRVSSGPSPDQVLALRDSILFGRDGKGIIHVFASGNGAGPAFSPGFQTIGNYGSTTYDGWVNSRYTIGVTGVDHDGLYANADGTFTAYPEISASVLIAAPTGSNAALNIIDDTGLGSGIWTTDLTGDNGYNMEPLEDGGELDRDFLPDPDYTSRFNGTSAAAPIATGAIALMLEANPNLTWRDVQEILVRSARQNSQFESPSSGGGLGSVNTWQMNQNPLFRNPDPWEAPPEGEMADPGLLVYTPKTDITIDGGVAHFESQPQLYTNAAGYTVSQGYGVYSELTGYAHGVIDAELAVKLARDWGTYSQQLGQELTFSTFVLQPGANIPAAEKLSQDAGYLLVPGAIGGQGGFGEYWEQYFVEDDPEDPEDGPFSDYDGPGEGQRGTPFLEFEVPDNNSMSIEHVEVKVDISGPAEDLDFLRIMLMSPEGTVSELNHYYHDPDFGTPISKQSMSGASSTIDPDFDIDVDGGNFTWTFSTNRSWGERSSNSVVIDPVTGEPAGGENGPFSRGWRLYIENWSDSDFSLAGLEVTWHGDAIGANTQRVQGLVGVDDNDDDDFNFSRVNSYMLDIDGKPEEVRLSEFQSLLDLTQESFAANKLVAAYRVVNGIVQSQPTAQFLTGADGNYYFDLVPDEYVIRVLDPETGEIVGGKNDDNPGFLPHFQSEWRITEDWFFAHDHTVAEADPITGLWKSEVNVDEQGTPVPFADAGAPIAMGLKNINFLLDRGDAAPDEVVVTGSVIADIDGNGIKDGDDTGIGEVTVYWDANRNGTFDSGEISTESSIGSADGLARGEYQLVIPATAGFRAQIGVVLPNGANSNWEYSNPTSGLLDFVAEPGDEFANKTFLIEPPEGGSSGGGTLLGNIFGVVFNDLDKNGVRAANEGGVAGFRVYIDANTNGMFDTGELSSFTDGSGTYSLSNVAPGTVQLRIETFDPWSLTAPESGVHIVTLASSGAVSSVRFGVVNNATSDWGDLAGYPTLASENGPSHTVVEGFYLGSTIDGEVDGQPTANADGDDAVTGDEDGVEIVSNGGVVKPGVNTVRVTVAGVGGLLQGWMDFNNDGDWDDAGEQVFANVDLNPGTYDLMIQAPASLAGGTIASRFRWGTPNLSYTGPSPLGEVEDYRFDSSVSVIQLVGDYNVNGLVDDADYGVWQSTFGSHTDLRADGNFDGVVDTADYSVWRDNYGASAAAAGTGAALATSSSVPQSSPLFIPFDYSGMSSEFKARYGVDNLIDYFESLGAWRLVSNHYDSSTTPITGTGTAIATNGPGSSGMMASVARNAIAAMSANYFSPLGGTENDSVATAQTGLIDSVAAIDLNLLDVALAEMADGDEDRSLAPSSHTQIDEQSEAISELALAVVFDDETTWNLM